MAGLYIHIPFCKSRCIYCGFYSTTMMAWRDRYVEALCREMAMRGAPSDSPKRGRDARSEEGGTRKEERGARIETVYLGGGTPSQLTGSNLQRLFDEIDRHYDISGVQEVTMECNPDDVTVSFAEMLPQLGINRVSLGIQTFSDERLRFLHRRHTAQQAVEAVRLLRQAGISNVSIDLMFGFPNENLSDWESDIRQALALDVEHISAYSLMVEEGTALYEGLKNGRMEGWENGRMGEWKDERMEELTPEVQREMYERLLDLLEAAGYEHYEISNFARHGFRSRHNSSYWNQTPYIGLGAAAHSYDGERRSWNISDIQQYVEAIEEGVIPSDDEKIDDDTRYNDLITTAMRTREGILLPLLEQKYRNYLINNSQKSIRSGLLTISKTPDGDRIHLTRKGLFVSDDVMSDLIYL